jgi:hypothetical protein
MQDARRAPSADPLRQVPLRQRDIRNTNIASTSQRTGGTVSQHKPGRRRYSCGRGNMLSALGRRTLPRGRDWPRSRHSTLTVQNLCLCRPRCDALGLVEGGPARSASTAFAGPAATTLGHVVYSGCIVRGRLCWGLSTTVCTRWEGHVNRRQSPGTPRISHGSAPSIAIERTNNSTPLRRVQTHHFLGCFWTTRLPCHGS